MMGGAWFDDLIKASDGLDENVLKSMATKAVSHQLNIHSKPNTVQVHVLNVRKHLLLSTRYLCCYYARDTFVAYSL